MTGRIFYFDFEIKIIEWLQSLYNPVTEWLSKFFALFSDEIVLIAIFGFLYWCYDKEKGKYVSTVFLPALIFSAMLKNVFFRRRPYMDTKTIKCLNPIDKTASIYDISAQGFSMPSLHSVNITTTLGSLAFVLKKKWLTVTIYVVIFLVGISRIIVGMHYPTDVIVGWGIGAIFIFVMTKLQKKIKNYLIYTIIFGLLALPGWFFCITADFYTAYGLVIGIFLSFYFEEKVVNFNNTRGVLRSIFRLIGGVGVFLIVITLIKLPFGDSLLNADTFVSHIIRTVRYMLGSFVSLGVYPILFKYTEKIGVKKK